MKWSRQMLEETVCPFDGYAPHAWMPRAKFNTPWRCGDCSLKVSAKDVEPLPPPAEAWLTAQSEPADGAP